MPAQFSWALSWLLFSALTVGFGQIVFAYLFKTLKRKDTQEEVQSLKT
jgi:hypothetical protein